MITILISGAGTGVGKTRVTGALGRVALRNGRSVQFIKPVQTGVGPGDPSDADLAAKFAGLDSARAFTLRCYPAALAPMAAAQAVNAKLEARRWPEEISRLPKVDLRLIEGAGGLAVPLGADGWDWVEFAGEMKVNAVVLVVRDELGAINQARLVKDYYGTKHRETPPGGVFLNTILAPPPDVAASTRAALEDCDLRLWGELAVNAQEPVLYYKSLLKWLVA